MRHIASVVTAVLLALAGVSSAAAGPEGASSPVAPSSATELGKADGLVTQCLLFFALGDLKGAEKTCSGALLFDPNRVEALKLRGYVYLLLGRIEQASADFQAGLRLRPSDDQLWAGYGQSLSDAGNFAQAVIQFRKAAELAPQKPAYWSSVCWTQGGTGEKLDEALAACNKAIALAPQAAAPFNSRGLVRLRMRQMPDAIADYRHSLELSSDQASALFGLGLARLWSGDTAGAADIRDARQKDPAIDWVFIAMGVVAERCELPGKAACPPGFPAAPRAGRGLLAKAAGSGKQQILRLAGF